MLAVQSVTHSLSVTPDEFFPPNPSLLSTIPSSSSFNFSHSHPSSVNNLYKWKILPYQLTRFLLQVVLQQLQNSSKRKSLSRAVCEAFHQDPKTFNQVFCTLTQYNTSVNTLNQDSHTHPRTHSGATEWTLRYD